MPQTTYLPVYTADYPILAKAQKPGGVTVLSAVGAGDVPNKPTYTAGTIQMVGALSEETKEASAEEATEEEHSPHTQDEVEDAEMEEAEENGEDGEPRRTTTTKRTTTRTTTTRRR
jgi:hypothetical protein